jgi:hypothetical protein
MHHLYTKVVLVTRRMHCLYRIYCCYCYYSWRINILPCLVEIFALTQKCPQVIYTHCKRQVSLVKKKSQRHHHYIILPELYLPPRQHGMYLLIVCSRLLSLPLTKFFEHILIHVLRRWLGLKYRYCAFSDGRMIRRQL